jgi:FkbM family methyltransferase
MFRTIRRLVALPRQTLVTYIRLVVVNRFLSPTHSGVATLCGYAMRYGSRANLHGMFSEAFVYENYALKATTVPITIVDCGANIGVSLLYFRMKAPNARIIAFEPHPATFALLSRNVEANALTVELHNLALANKHGETTLYTPEGDTASQSASVHKDFAVRAKALTSLTVKTAPLSAYITGPVDVLKIDIEGAELSVLEDLTESGAIAHVHMMFVEYHYITSEEHSSSFARFLQLIEDAGFTYAMDSSVSLPFYIPKKTIGISYKIIAWRAQKHAPKT